MNKNIKTTKKYVLTGGPGIGKTTILELLSSRGYDIVPEAARYIIEEQQAVDGDALPWKDGAKFQRMVMNHQLSLEDGLLSEIVFLDRGLVDGDGYCKYFGVDSPEGMSELGKNRYERVFILDRLPEYRNDSVRLENPVEAEEIHHAVIDAYVRFGYEPVIVPVLTPDERVDFILARI